MLLKGLNYLDTEFDLTINGEKMVFECSKSNGLRYEFKFENGSQSSGLFCDGKYKSFLQLRQCKNDSIQSPCFFLPRALLKGPKRSFIVVVLLVVGVET